MSNYIKVKDYKGNEVDFEAAMNLMDEDLREELANYGFDSDQEFFEAYAARHSEKFDGEDFAPFYGGAW